MKKTTFTANSSMRNKQRGALLAEYGIYIAAIVISLIFVVSQAPSLRQKYLEIRFISQAHDIATETFAWQKLRPNFDGVTITKVCEEGGLSRSICGSANDGRSTNSYGGDWQVRVNTGSKGLFDVTGTLPANAERIPSLANSLAPSTRANCVEADGCSTIATTASSITMTH